MHRRALLLVPILLLAAAACGGDEDPPPPTPGPEATAGASPAAGASPGAADDVPADVRQWMAAVCTLDGELVQAQNELPGSGAGASDLSLEERKQRAATFWPASAALHEAYVQDIDQIAPPPRVEALHNAIRDLSVMLASELRRSAEEVDAIFASEESLEANNEVLQATERSGFEAVNELFVADAAVNALYRVLPECQLAG